MACRCGMVEDKSQRKRGKMRLESGVFSSLSEILPLAKSSGVQPSSRPLCGQIAVSRQDLGFVQVLSPSECLF